MVGVNIQYPISQEILNGNKSVETRTYPLPPKYAGQKMAMIETPGKDGDFKARIVGHITFKNSFKYNDEDEFYKDIGRHLVDRDSPWKYGDKGKHGWEIESIERFPEPIPAPEKKGIVFTTGIEGISNLLDDLNKKKKGLT